ncbi:MAG: hypothetical protein ACRD0D_05060 [Acidimicrobiales bacterium]
MRVSFSAWVFSARAAASVVVHFSTRLPSTHHRTRYRSVPSVVEVFVMLAIRLPSAGTCGSCAGGREC